MASVLGEELYVNEPTLEDLETFKNYMKKRIRKEYLDMARGESDETFHRLMLLADAKSSQVTGQEFETLIGEGIPDKKGLAIFFHAFLRRRNKVDLTWCMKLVQSAYDGDTDALKGIEELKDDINAMSDQKKREVEEAREGTMSLPQTSLSD